MVNVGIIGAGRIGKVHVESICTQVKDAKVKMLADPFMNDETAKWAKDMGVEAVTKDYKEILADPEIDAVLICSSTDTHSPISVEAIKAGKHVFCEKPIDHDVAKIKEVIDALKDSNVKYQVGFNRRFALVLRIKAIPFLYVIHPIFYIKNSFRSCQTIAQLN